MAYDGLMFHTGCNLSCTLSLSANQLECLHFSIQSPQNGQSNHSNGQSQHVSTGCNTIPCLCTSILLFLQNSPDHAKVQVVNNRVLFSRVCGWRDSWMFFVVFDSQRLNIDIQPRLRKTDPDHLLRRLNLWFLASRTDPSRMQRAGSQQALVFIEITKRALVMECSFTA